VRSESMTRQPYTSCARRTAVDMDRRSGYAAHRATRFPLPPARQGRLIAPRADPGNPRRIFRYRRPPPATAECKLASNDTGGPAIGIRTGVRGPGSRRRWYTSLTPVERPEASLSAPISANIARRLQVANGPIIQHDPIACLMCPQPRSAFSRFAAVCARGCGASTIPLRDLRF